MTEFVEVKTAELIGPALRYAVATAEGLGDELRWCFNEDGAFRNIWTDNHGAYWPDEDWEIGGPLLAKHAIGFVGHDADNWLAFSSPCDVTHQGIGGTHLIAACRLVVSAALGETVSVPKELLSC